MNEIKDIFTWHDYFVWLPLVIDGEIVWLKTVQRRAIWVYPGNRAYEALQSWEYKLK